MEFLNLIPKTTISARKRESVLNIGELLRYRDLFMILAWRDLKVRYAQTFLGLTWALIQPLAMLLLFVLIFGKALNVDSGAVPYPVFALTGMSAWAYFSFVLQQSGNSIIGAQEMIKKIYFPRLIIPLAKSITGFVDFLVTGLFLLVLMIVYQVPVSGTLLTLPIFVGMVLLVSLGTGIWTSALSIRYRDIQHIVPFVVQLGLYASPVAYPVDLIPEKWKLLFYCNPMAGVIDGFRYAILGREPDWTYVSFSLIIGLLIFITSLFYFRRVERVMADLL